MKEKHRLSQLAINEMTTGFAFLSEKILENAQKQLLKLAENGTASVKEQEDQIAECFANVNPFAGLETEWLQNKYYENNFNLLVSFSMLILEKNP